MNPQVPSTLDQAIFEIEARTNSATYCSVVATDEAGKQKVLLNQEPYDQELVRGKVEGAFTYYPNHRISLLVYDPWGSRNKLNTTYLLINPNTAQTTMGGISTSYHQPQQNAQQFSQTPTGEGLGLNAMANYLLNEKNQQITDLKEQLRELRDTNRIHEATIKDEREKRWKLEQDLQLKDREFNLEKLEIEATTSKGLNGILDRATSLIEQKPDILGYILPYFMGKGAAPLQIGGVPEQASPVAHMSTEAQQTYQELTQWLATVPEQALGEFFAIAMLAAQKKINLSQIISSTQNANL